MRERRGGLSQKQVFLIVSLIDLMACNALVLISMAPGIWLLNLPATVTVGRLASVLVGDAGALAVTIPAGAVLYGWAGARLYRGAFRI